MRTLRAMVLLSFLWVTGGGEAPGPRSAMPSDGNPGRAARLVLSCGGLRLFCKRAAGSRIVFTQAGRVWFRLNCNDVVQTGSKNIPGNPAETCFRRDVFSWAGCKGQSSFCFRSADQVRKESGACSRAGKELRSSAARRLRILRNPGVSCLRRSPGASALRRLRRIRYPVRRVHGAAPKPCRRAVRARPPRA